MKVQVRLFAVAKQLAGQELVNLELPEGATIAQVREQLAADLPALAPVLSHVLFAIGTNYAQDSQVVTPADAIACIPPVSGG